MTAEGHDSSARHITYKPWTNEEIDRLRELRKTLKLPEAAAALGRTLQSTRHAAQRYGVKYPSELTWTPEVEEFARDKWIEGWSAAKIGAAIGFTRNAVIGKVNRMGLKGLRPKNNTSDAQRIVNKREYLRTWRKSRPKPPAPPKNIFQKIALEAAPINLPPESEWVPFLENRGCKDILDTSKGNQRCCGRPIVYRSNCAEHARVNYRAAR